MSVKLIQTVLKNVIYTPKNTISNYIFIPIKLMNPNAIKPQTMKVIPRPLSGSGILEYLIKDWIGKLFMLKSMEIV